MAITSLLVGSTVIADQPITIDGSPEVVSGGNLYLRHPTASLSLINQLQSELAMAGIVGPSVVVLENLLIRVAALEQFDLVLSARLQRLLGFTSATTGLSSYTSQLVSPLLWAAGYRATPGSRAGKAGYKVQHMTRHKADDGSRQETQWFGEEVWQELEWPFVPTEKLSVADDEDDGGTFEGLYEETLKYGYPFHYYESVNVVADDSPIGWTPSFGPYQLRTDPGNPNWYDRIVSNADDIGGGVGLQMHLVEEIE